MRDKYRAVVEARFILQIDDPGIATSWDMIKPEPSLADYRKYVTLRTEALNHALAGIPPEKVRYHWCWGSWHGAHVNDIPLEHIIDIALEVKAQTYSFEAANVRHQHEMGVWRTTKLASGTILMPGVISHATNIVEHPELIARRLVDWRRLRHGRAGACRNRLGKVGGAGRRGGSRDENLGSWLLNFCFRPQVRPFLAVTVNQRYCPLTAIARSPHGDLS
jgi:hypothetical protein